MHQRIIFPRGHENENLLKLLCLKVPLRAGSLPSNINLQFGALTRPCIFLIISANLRIFPSSSLVSLGFYAAIFCAHIPHLVSVASVPFLRYLPFSWHFISPAHYEVNPLPFVVLYYHFLVSLQSTFCCWLLVGSDSPYNSLC